MSSTISVIAELENYGIEFDWAAESEVKVKCPFHDDSSPSCFVNIEKLHFKCQTAGCGAHGDFVSLLARFLKTTRQVVYADLGTRYDLTKDKIVSIDTVERYHTAIWSAKPLLKALYDRCITDDIIKRYRLGESDGRITIPIKNESGLIVNLRKYLPGAPGAQKMRNLKGHGQIRLFPIDQLKFDRILVTGGEMKALVAAEELNRHGIGAITATCGEDNWDQELSKKFIGKQVWVCNDIDEAGQKAAEVRCAMLHNRARWVGNVVLPLDIDKHPKGDINDYAAEGGKLLPLLEAAEPWEHKGLKELDDNEEAKDANLTEAVSAHNTGKRLRISSVISAMDTAPYSIPREVEVHCTEDQKMCVTCPVVLAGKHKFEIKNEDPAVLEMVGGTKRAQRDVLISALDIPRRCPVCEFTVDSYHNVEDVRVSPQLQITNRVSEKVQLPAYCIGGGLELNESYKMEGRMWPHPQTQQATLLISNYETTEDALSTYRLKDPATLETFKPDELTFEGIRSKLHRIYEDLEANVTRIFQRRELHLIVDLAYHSPLFIEFDGRTEKGWVEALIMGDSAQGKSDTTKHLMSHYGLGEKVECKNATVAGLLGGLQQMGTRWFVTWGVIPTHDKRLVVLEELKGASTEVIGRLTDMRSSGIAEIPKIEKRRTSARTRLIALSNPRGDMPLHAYNFGIEAIKELVGSLEDIRRFDIFGLVSAKEIDAKRLNELQSQRPEVKHVYTSELCHELVLWTWTRSRAQFTDEAKSAILAGSTELSSKFTDAIPIFDRSSGRLKIARLAAALAGRLFSHDADYQLLVQKPHVEFIVYLLDKMYSESKFGYADFSKAIEVSEMLKDPDAVKSKLESAPFPKDLCQQLIHTNNIEIQDLQDWCGYERGEAQILLSFFVRKHCLVRDKRSYRKTGPFIELLKDLVESDKLHDRPSYIEEDF